MTRPDRFDPLALPGSIAYLLSAVPPLVTLPAWRRGPRPGGWRPAGARVGASAARRTRRRHEEAPVRPLHLTDSLTGLLAVRHGRREALRRLGRQARLAAYRRGEFDFESCCLWAAGYPHEVPLLNGESSSSRSTHRRFASRERRPKGERGPAGPTGPAAESAPALEDSPPPDSEFDGMAQLIDCSDYLANGVDDLNCADIADVNFPTPPVDEDGLDGDGDGIACEV